MSQERLDQIEDEFETVKQLLVPTARMAERNSESIERLTNRIDRLTTNVDKLAVSQLNTEEKMNQLAVSQLNADQRMNQLAALVIRFIENGEQDRAVIREIQSEVRGLQAENRRILDHLFGQQR